MDRVWPNRILLLGVAAVLALVATQSGARSGEREPPGGDQCRESPRTARDVAFGCTAIQLVRRPQVFVAPLLEALDANQTMLDREPAFGPAMHRLDHAAKTFEKATRELRSGDLCHAARTAGEGAGDVDDAVGLLDTQIDRRALEVARAHGHADNGDVDDDELGLASWHLQRALVEQTGGQADDAAAAMDAVCAAVAGPLHVRGTVAENDDASGLVALRDGPTVGLAATKHLTPAAPGTQIDIDGVFFDDGTGLATSTKGKAAKAKPLLPGCAQLRIAPIQRFSGPLTLHRPSAYEGSNGVLQLEEGVRFGAVNGSCPGATPEGHALHYGLMLDLDQGPVHETIATDLREGEGAVELPDVLDFGENATLTATVYRTNCLVLGPDFESCQPPEQMTSTQFTLVVRELGFYAFALYDHTGFGVTDDGVAGNFEAAEALGVFTLVIPASTNPTFSAEGYKVTGGVSSRPAVVPIAKFDDFAVYSDDFFNPGFLWKMDEYLATGQERPSGLRWARVIGTRNGNQFWYSMRLPAIQHDRVSVCPTLAPVTVPMGGPKPNGGNYPPPAPYMTQQIKDSYYELPFENGFSFGTGTNGNIDDSNEARRHGIGQAYALDLGAPLDTPLVAARGGVVTFVEESDPYNIWTDADGNPDPPPGADAAPEGWTGIGNYMFIRHEDGTYAVYFHMPEDSVIPSVSSHVRRGQQIGVVGQSGNASGPHVHIGFATNETHNKSAFVHRVRYRAKVGGNINGCYIPRSADSYSSTNHAPTPD